MTDLSNTIRYDDNSLFKYFSKAYGKKKSQSISDQRNCLLKHEPGIKTLQNLKKIRCQSSSTPQQRLSDSIVQTSKSSKLGFLKYRKFSVNESLVPLNSSITTSKSFYRLSQTLKSNKTEQKDHCQIDRIKVSMEDFGLRNVVKRVQNQFRSQDDGHKSVTEQKEYVDGALLCDESRKMFSGYKSYNLNSFVITENVKGFKKRKINSVKQSFIKRKIKTLKSRQISMTIN